jgi:hypothetical protein
MLLLKNSQRVITNYRLAITTTAMSKRYTHVGKEALTRAT